MKSLAVIQSSYIPWKGYFDMIDRVDEFILYDDVQYTKNDWRNRNLIKSHEGTTWLTIPVRTKGRFGQLVREAEISDPRWASKHWKSLAVHYARAPYFNELAPRVEAIYERAAGFELLSPVNELFIRAIAELLGIETRIRRSDEFDLPEDRIERLIALCKAVGADIYVSGPAARAYLDEEPFEREGIRVRWMSYDGYPEYPQLHGGDFVHAVSILDLLFSVGPDQARSFLERLPGVETES